MNLINELLLSDPLSVIGLLFALVFVFWLIATRRSSKLSRFISNSEGEKDLDKLGQLICMLTMTWIVIHMELKGRTTEWAFGLYALAWVGAGYRKFMSNIRGIGSTTTESETRRTKVTQEAPAQEEKKL